MGQYEPLYLRQPLQENPAEVMMSKVLLIESVDDDAAMMTELFADAGYEVVRAGDGREGVEMARSESPALIVLAVELPGLSGYIACKNIRRDKDLSDIPLIITSSTATDETFEQHRSLKTRADAYLHKPLDAESLMLAASDYLTFSESEEDVDDDLFLDPDEDFDAEAGEELELSDDLDVEEIEEIDDIDMGDMDDMEDMLDFELTSQELDLDALGDSVADVMGDLEVVDMSDEKPKQPSSHATPSVPGAALDLSFQEKEKAKRNKVPTAPAPESKQFDTAEASDDDMVQELLLQVEARDERIERLESALDEAKNRGGDPGKLEAEVAELKEELATQKDIEATQQEAIDRLQLEKEELQKALTEARESAGDADAAEEAIARAEKAEAELASLKGEMTELLGGLRELLDSKLNELGGESE